MLPILVLTLAGLSGCVKRSESDVVVYSALDREFALPILASFQRSTEDQTKVIAKYDVESTKTVGLVNLIIAEKDAPNCDLFWNNEIMHTVRLQKLGLLQPRKWNVEAGYPTNMVASDGSWCGFAVRARVLLVNTNLIPDPGEYPSSVSELADPRWSKKCAIARPLFGTTATHFAVLRETMGRDATIEMLRKISQNAVVLSGNKQVALAVSSGQVAWGLTDTDDAIIEKDQGRRGGNCVSRSGNQSTWNVADPEYGSGSEKCEASNRSRNFGRSFGPSRNRGPIGDGRQ